MPTTVEINLNDITAELDCLKSDEAQLKFQLKQVEKEIEKRELQLQALLNQTGVETMDFHQYQFGYKTQSRTSLDQVYLRENFSEIAEKCTFTKEQKKFYFAINKDLLK